jgi:hypothetical protein
MMERSNTIGDLGPFGEAILMPEANKNILSLGKLLREGYQARLLGRVGFEVEDDDGDSHLFEMASRNLFFYRRSLTWSRNTFSARLPRSGTFSRARSPSSRARRRW